MDHFIEQIVIEKFKSIRHLQLSGLKRINLFIGRPNVGKSNILEALSLFGISYVLSGTKLLTEIIRLENYRELFFDGDISKGLAIGYVRKDVGIKECHISFNKNNAGIDISIRDRKSKDNNIINRYGGTVTGDLKFRLKADSNSHIFDKNVPKRYVFSNTAVLKEVNSAFLQPPFGGNLLHVLELNLELRKMYSQWFRQYGLRLVLDTASQSLKVQKEKGDDEVFQLPYSSVADTLQRIIFYKTAVASNENSVLLFEEPEAHAFPPYIVEFTQEVIQSLTNQFFIVTHSPLIVEEFLTNAIDDLGIFNVDFKDGQTVVRPLTTGEIYDVRKYGVDLFFNNEAYLA